jgi:hypothetical protein
MCSTCRRGHVSAPFYAASSWATLSLSLATRCIGVTHSGFLAPHRQELEELLPKIEEFLALRLKLALHPDKVSIRPLNHGIDFLGIVVHPFHRTLRTTTKRRMLRKLAERHGEAFRGEIDSDSLHQSLQSYLGILSQVDGHELSTILKNGYSLFSAY